MSVRTVLIAALLILPMSAGSAPKPATAPDYSAVCHPGEAKGVVLCETAESYHYCKSLEGKGTMLVEGDDPAKPTAVVSCQQAG